MAKWSIDGPNLLRLTNSNYGQTTFLSWQIKNLVFGAHKKTFYKAKKEEIRLSILIMLYEQSFNNLRLQA